MAPSKSDQNPKTLDRKSRIQLATSWAKTVASEKKIKAYMKYFGVDKLCAAKELTVAGVELKEKFADKWATRHERKAVARKQKRKKLKEKTLEMESSDSDQFFYFIAGYTPAGFAYGITWEQAVEEGLIKCDDHTTLS